MTMRPTMVLACIAFALVTAGAARADDWPEFRGKGRLGVWHETGLLEKFPAAGLKVLWRDAGQGGLCRPGRR